MHNGTVSVAKLKQSLDTMHNKKRDFECLKQGIFCLPYDGVIGFKDHDNR